MTDRRVDEEEAEERKTDKDYEEIEVADPEMEERISDFYIQDKAEGKGKYATLYRLVKDIAGRERPEQLNYYSNVLPPSRHEIGIKYGGGRYMLVMSTGTKREDKKSTSFRFTLNETYNQLKKENDALNAPAVADTSLTVQRSGGESIREAMLLIDGLMRNMMQMFSPFLERAIAPPVQYPALPEPKQDPFGTIGLMKDMLRNSVKNDIQFVDEMRRKMTTDMQKGDIDEYDTLPEAEKEGVFEKIIKVIEPFLGILAQNSIPAKVTAAGIKAIPDAKAVINQIAARPDLSARIAQYVVAKEGVEGARNVLQHFGIPPERYLRSPAVAQKPVISAGNAPKSPERPKTVESIAQIRRAHQAGRNQKRMEGKK